MGRRWTVKKLITYMMIIGLAMTKGIALYQQHTSVIYALRYIPPQYEERYTRGITGDFADSEEYWECYEEIAYHIFLDFGYEMDEDEDLIVDVLPKFYKQMTDAQVAKYEFIVQKFKRAMFKNENADLLKELSSLRQASTMKDGS